MIVMTAVVVGDASGGRKLAKKIELAFIENWQAKLEISTYIRQISRKRIIKEIWQSGLETMGSKSRKIRKKKIIDAKG